MIFEENMQIRPVWTKNNLQTETTCSEAIKFKLDCVG